MSLKGEKRFFREKHRENERDRQWMNEKYFNFNVNCRKVLSSFRFSFASINYVSFSFWMNQITFHENVWGKAFNLYILIAGWKVKFFDFVNILSFSFHILSKLMTQIHLTFYIYSVLSPFSCQHVGLKFISIVEFFFHQPFKTSWICTCWIHSFSQQWGMRVLVKYEKNFLH